MEIKRVIYYENELNDEFSDAKITPRVIDGNYKYSKGPVWEFVSLIIQNVLSMPIKLIYPKFKFKIKYVGKEKFKKCKDQGYFIYANHTQAFCDTFIPSVANYPKRNFLIVNPENVSMKFMKTLVEMLGAIPIPGTKTAMVNFLKTIHKRIIQGHSITIYPEAHIWPFYTKIRPFKDVSFKYPVELNTPVFSITNTYHACGTNYDKVKIVSYIDGPFYPRTEINGKILNKKQIQKDLRDQVYNCMVERSKKSNIEYIKYIKK